MAGASLVLFVKRWQKNMSTFYTLVSPVLQEVVFREDSEKNGLGVAPRSCFGVQGGCFLSSLSEGSALPPSILIPLLFGIQTLNLYVIISNSFLNL